MGWVHIFEATTKWARMQLRLGMTETTVKNHTKMCVQSRAKWREWGMIVGMKDSEPHEEVAKGGWKWGIVHEFII